MPAALVPRPWDFPVGPPKAPINPDIDAAKGNVGEPKVPANPGVTVPTAPLPKPVNSILDVVADKPTVTPTVVPTPTPAS